MSRSDIGGIRTPISLGRARPHKLRWVTRFHCLTFVTDYGLEDAFVAVCHAVAFQIAPDLQITDITHLVPLGDIRRGAMVLAQAVPYFPPAVHVAVVDPGVGTARRGVAVAAGDSLFVGPDNGLLSVAVARAGGATRAVSLTNRALWRDTTAATFHGRDIFMPVAARLASGMPIDEAGEPVEVTTLVALPQPGCLVTGNGAEAEVVTIDGFGNVQLSLPGADAPRAGLVPGANVRLAWDDKTTTMPFRTAFGEVAPGEPLCYRDSGDWVAIAVSGGSAAQQLGLRPGTAVTLTVT
ncbi:MAG: SAM-dependent chlorinase/fluorinase [Actinobacteria bacterium]|nr:SAM-dependent chlorinase/fluorinase [Actinomycetota bacterium]